MNHVAREERAVRILLHLVVAGERAIDLGERDAVVAPVIGTSRHDRGLRRALIRAEAAFEQLHVRQIVFDRAMPRNDDRRIHRDEARTAFVIPGRL